MGETLEEDRLKQRKIQPCVGTPRCEARNTMGNPCHRNSKDSGLFNTDITVHC